MNKKLFILGIIVVVLIVFGGTLVYYKKTADEQKGEDFASLIDNEKNEESKENSESQLPPQIEIQAVSGENASEGSLIICVDKCGDGVCQNEETVCEGGNLNCVCVETMINCPQDCKK